MVTTFRLNKKMSNDNLKASTNYGDDFVQFLNQSPTPFHAIHSMSQILENKGFKKLDETLPFHGNVEANGKYYITRNGSSIVSFVVGGKWDPTSKESSFSIIGSHTD